MKRSSIVEEETKDRDDRENYKKIYASDVNKITSFQVKDLAQQRTESFRENLNQKEFKKYLADQKKNQKAPNTQLVHKRQHNPRTGLINRFGRLSKKTENKLKQDDLENRKNELA